MAWSKHRPLHLAPQHGELVAQDHDLEGLVDLALSSKDKELEETLEHYIKEGEHHGPGIVPTGRLIHKGDQCC